MSALREWLDSDAGPWSTAIVFCLIFAGFIAALALALD